MPGLGEMKIVHAGAPRRRHGSLNPLRGNHREKAFDWKPAVLLVVLTCAVYWPVVKCGFILDDDQYVHENRALRSLPGLARIWLEPGATPQYYPLTFTTFWIEYHCWGANPLGYHVTNVLLHCACTLLLWRVLRLLEIPGAWVAAAIFAIHPIQVQSVAWITERKNVLAGAFYFASALAYLRWAGTVRGGAVDESPRSLGPKKTISSEAAPISNRLYWLSLALFICSLLSKTVTGTLPAALLLVQWWKTGRVEWRAVRALLPFFVASLVLNAFIAWREEFVLCANRDWGVSFAEKWPIAGRALWFYAGKLLWPSQLVFVYPMWKVDASAWQEWWYLMAAVLLVVCLWIGRRAFGRGPLTAVLFFGGTLFPALGFFTVGWLQYSFVADYFLHLASIGLIVLLTALGTVHLYRRGRRGALAGRVLAILVLAALGLRTAQRIGTYADLEAMWRDTVAQNPESWQANFSLGDAVQRKGRLDEAMSYFRKAEAIKPDEVAILCNIAIAVQAQGDNDAAEKYCRAVLDIEPDNGPANNNLGLMLAARGECDEAVEHLQRAATAAPNAAKARFNLGLALQTCGRFDEALTRFREALEREPNWPTARAAIAWILATHPDPVVRRPQEAVALAEQARRLSRDQDAAIMDTAAAAYAAAGRFEDALAMARKAEAAATKAGATELARQIHARADLYAVGKQYTLPVGTSDE